jgi:probable HAF family extracellular repeat protein
VAKLSLLVLALAAVAAMLGGTGPGASDAVTPSAGWTMHRLGAIERPAAINGRGQVVGWSLRGSGFRVLRWHNGRLRVLPNLENSSWLPTPDHLLSRPAPGADVLNERGEVVGTSNQQGSRPVMWDATGAIRNLGTLGAENSTVVGINERGEVIGLSSTGKTDPSGFSISRAFLWKNGRIRDLGALGRHESAQVGVEAINDRGQVVGESETDSYTSGESGYRSYDSHGYLWQNGVMRDIGGISPIAINNRGQILAERFAERTHAVLWQSGRARPLGAWRPIAINARGQVIGSRSAPNSNCISRAVLWENGRLRQLNGLPGHRRSQALGINDRGQIVGVSYNRCIGPILPIEIEGSRPFIWQRGRTHALPIPPRTEATVVAINNRGEVLGYAEGPGFSGAVLWTPAAA